MAVESVAQAVELLSATLIAALEDNKPEELTETARGQVFGVAWALGMLLDPPPPNTLVMLSPPTYVTAGFEYATLRAIERLIDE